jgi:hypothetical protein
MKSLLATVAMSGVLLWWMGAVVGRSVWLVALGGIGLGGVVYGVVMVVLRVEEVGAVLNSLKNRFWCFTS